MIISPEAVESALRSWSENGNDIESAFAYGYDDGPTQVGIEALARHVAAVLSTEPARFEVSGGPIETVVVVDPD